ncbi:hypothetical protein BDV18DRAFT_162027 [Aspergillus unguis]
MGSSASKPARSAAQAASRRQYPKKPSAPSPAATKRSPPPQASASPSNQQPSHASHEPKVPPQSPAQGPTYHSKEKAATEKSSAIDLDGRDPHFAASLRSIGPVTPAPTFSNSSTFNQPQASPQGSQPTNANSSVFPSAPMNPALLAVTARQRITKEAEAETEEYGRGGFGGRRYVDAFTIRQALAMRDRQGLTGNEIEKTLRLRTGVLQGLGSGGKGVNGIIGIP